VAIAAIVSNITASASVTAVLSQLRTRAARLVAATSLAAAVVLVQTPQLASLLHLQPLHVDDWLLGLAGGASVAVPMLAARYLRSREDRSTRR